MESGLNKKLISYEFDDALSELITLFCKNSSFEEIKQIYEFLCPFLEKKLKSQKLVAIITFAQFVFSVFHTSDENYEEQYYQKMFELVNKFLEIMLENSGESEELIRKHAIKGIGNIYFALKTNFAENENNEPQQQEQQEQEQQQQEEEIKEGEQQEIEQQVEVEEKYNITYKLNDSLAEQMLYCLLQGMEDSSSIVAREALLSIQKLIQLLQNNIVQPNILNVLARLPQNFEKCDIHQRMGAFNLFGKVCSLVIPENENIQEIHQNIHYFLISLLLHITDESSAVKSSCLNALIQISSLLELQELTKLLEIFHESQLPLPFKLLSPLENLSLQIFQILWDNYPQHSQKYLDCIYDFCQSPDDQTKGNAVFLLCQGIVLSRVNQSIDEKWTVKVEEMWSVRNEIVKQKVCKGVYLLCTAGDTSI
eukprot:TRINITY_DN9099_c0_g1_i1.p1 TRINITY_DN9099_c0_g1~~TRINITY_DN9099_c0_g1_i1.p1  ORF type:complete len:424 (+),score=76.50 TRINITY_DN9099_c0_g1_i1:799-2070(+)